MARDADTLVNLSGTLTGNGSGAAGALGYGQFFASVSGAFDSATMTLQVSLDDGSTWIGVEAFTAAATKVGFNAVRGAKYRWTLSSAGASTDIDWTLAQGKP